MCELAIVDFKYTVTSQQSHDAAQRLLVGADGSGKLGAASRRLVEFISDPKLGDGVKTCRQAVAGRDLTQSRKWTGFNHEKLSCLSVNAVLRGSRPKLLYV
jgi:hypothetical protein